MNQIGLDINSLAPHLIDYLVKRSEVTDQIISAPGEPRIQTSYCFNSYAKIRDQLRQCLLPGTDDDRIKAAAIKPRKNHQQQAFSAARFAGVVVKKDLHL